MRSTDQLCVARGLDGREAARTRRNMFRKLFPSWPLRFISTIFRRQLIPQNVRGKQTQYTQPAGRFASNSSARCSSCQDLGAAAGVSLNPFALALSTQFLYRA